MNISGKILKDMLRDYASLPISELADLLRECDRAYRTGDHTFFTSNGAELTSDKAFDEMCDHLMSVEPDNKVLAEVGYVDFDDPRMETIPVRMGSMYKIKTIEEYNQWLKSKGIPPDTLMIISYKYDGISMCVDEEDNANAAKKAWTRGNGVKGQRSDEWYGAVPSPFPTKQCYTVGEMIMPSDTFFSKYDANTRGDARNFVSGLFNSGSPSKQLEDVRYVRYGVAMKDGTHLSKKEQLDFLNGNSSGMVHVPYVEVKASDVTHQMLYDIFFKWRDTLNLAGDGLVIDVNDIKLRMLLGRESSKYAPAYARAFKGDFEEVKEVEVTKLENNISKGGLLKPIVHITPVKLDGVTVSKATGYNARFLIENQIGIGAVVKIKRSGMVIPKIIEVVKTSAVIVPDVCPSCGSKLTWTLVDKKQGADLQCTNEDCTAMQYKKILFFFTTLGTANVGPGTVDLLYDAGYDTLQKILAMNLQDYQKLPGFGDRKADIVYGSIKRSTVNVPLHIYMHASGYFGGLGSKKIIKVLEAIQKLNGDHHITFDEVRAIEGFAEKSARMYWDGVQRFKALAATVPVTFAMPDFSVKANSGFSGNTYVFTGFRDKVIQQRIEKLGGKVASAVSGKTTHLVMKDPEEKLTKYQAAVKVNAIIMTYDELMKQLDEVKD